MYDPHVLKRISLILLALLAIGACIPEGAEAGKRKKAFGTRITSGTDRHGNDFMDMSHHGSKRFKSSAGRHFSMEELLFGPGDQSNIWDRVRGERLEPRSGYGRGGRRGSPSDGFGYEDDDYEYEDSCANSSW